MLNNLRMFEWLGYGGLAVSLLGDFLGRKVDLSEGAQIAILTLAAAALVWAAARKGQRWAAALFCLVTVFAVLSTIGHFWIGGPEWLQDIMRPDASLNAAQKTLDFVATVMILGSVFFYFSAGREQIA